MSTTTEEIASYNNWFRLVVAVNFAGKNLCQSILHCYEKYPSDEKELFKSLLQYKEIFQRKLEEEIITQADYKKIYPENGTSDTSIFNLPLFILVLEVLFGDKYKKVCMLLKDRSNKIFSEVSVKFTKEKFEKNWDEMVKFLDNLGCNITLIKDLKTCSLDGPSQYKDTILLVKQTDHQKQVRGNTQLLQTVQSEIKDTKDSIRKIEELQNDIEERQTRLTQSHGIMHERISKLENEDQKRKTEEPKYDLDFATGFVHKLSPVKMSRNSTRYFDAVLQTGESKYDRLVCFSPQKRKLFESASEDKSAISIRPVKRKPYFSNDYEYELIVPSKASIIEKVTPDFEFAAIEENSENAPLVKISELNKYTNQQVSCVLYIHIEDCPTVPVRLPYKEETLPRKECIANDDTGCTRISLWDFHIKTVSSSGTYLVNNAVVKSQNPVFLTTNTKTRITVAETKIKPLISEISKNTFKATFPPEYVRDIIRRYWCSKCKRYQANGCPNSDLFSCETCSTKAMKEGIKFDIEVKVGVKVNEELKSIIIPCPQLEEYFKILNVKMPDTDENISLALLKGESTVMFFNDRDYCIGFQPFHVERK